MNERTRRAAGRVSRQGDLSDIILKTWCTMLSYILIIYSIPLPFKPGLDNKLTNILLRVIV